MRLIKYTLVSIFSLFALSIYSQIPTDVPNPRDDRSVDFSEPANIVIFIVLPLLVVVFLLIWRSKNRKDKSAQR